MNLKVLNLYAGIGGNRKLWQDVDVTAVEIDPEIAKIYQSYFPDDKVIVGDAHQYLLDHYKEYDFIWASPPCPTHSKMNTMICNRTSAKSTPIRYADMSLYQEIILLSNWYKGKYCIENVKPYYTPLIPAKEIDRHLYWTNFNIGKIEVNDRITIKGSVVKEMEKKNGFDISSYAGPQRKDRILRNCVNSDIGLYILNCARNIITKSNIHQLDIFE
jgi:DNA (cytosine-5)-methyltransferase 1